MDLENIMRVLPNEIKVSAADYLTENKNILVIAAIKNALPYVDLWYDEKQPKLTDEEFEEVYEIAEKRVVIV
jgi:transketolase C-terminal domain/subunit